MHTLSCANSYEIIKSHIAIPYILARGGEHVYNLPFCPSLGTLVFGHLVTIFPTTLSLTLRRFEDIASTQFSAMSLSCILRRRTSIPPVEGPVCNRLPGVDQERLESLSHWQLDGRLHTLRGRRRQPVFCWHRLRGQR